MRKFYTFLLLLAWSTAQANLPYHPIKFPRDAGAHYRNTPYSVNRLMEWWYFNGIAHTAEGKQFSFDVAFFNPAVILDRTMTFPMLHIQISDLTAKKSFGTRENYDADAASVSTDKLDITIPKDFQLHQSIDHGKIIYQLKARGNDDNTHLKLDLRLEQISNPFLINGNGLMPMENNTNSYYYSIPRFKTSGTISINGHLYHVSQQTSESWMDHQWGDFKVSENGWEWFSVRLDNGLIANIFLIIDYQSNRVTSGLANIILPSGEKRFIPYSEFKVSRDDYWYDESVGISYPTTFTFEFPQLGLKLRNTAAFAEQELHGYWEGYCNVEATYLKQESKGFSFTELVYKAPTGWRDTHRQ